VLLASGGCVVAPDIAFWFLVCMGRSGLAEASTDVGVSCDVV